jgi:hypothetical protein
MEIGLKRNMICGISTSTFGSIGESGYSGGDGNSCSKAAAMTRDSIIHRGWDIVERGKRSTGTV